MLVSAAGWPTEIVDFHGQRNRLDLKVGDLLLFEAGAVIFARPVPFEGNKYACVYVDLVAKNGRDLTREGTFEEQRDQTDYSFEAVETGHELDSQQRVKEEL